MKCGCREKGVFFSVGFVKGETISFFLFFLIIIQGLKKFEMIFALVFFLAIIRDRNELLIIVIYLVYVMWMVFFVYLS